MMRIAVAGEKSLQANDADGIRRADQHGAADAALNQSHPAQDQRAHDAFAEIGFRDQQRAQSFRRYQQRFDVTLGMTVDQRDAARELADFGEKLTGSLIDHRRDVAETVALGDRDMAGQDDEHARSGFAGLEQPFAVLVGSDVAEPAHARNLLQRQRRKCLLMSRKCGSRRSAAIGLVSRRIIRAHLHLTPLKGNRTCRANQCGYSLGFFPLPSCSETSSSLEDAIRVSLRPRACDFRRLRFSRSASFSRSCLGSFLGSIRDTLPGFFAGVPVCASRLSFSSFIVDLFECIAAAMSGPGRIV